MAIKDAWRPSMPAAHLWLSVRVSVLYPQFLATPMAVGFATNLSDPVKVVTLAPALMGVIVVVSV